ncbi:hypothetical protein CLV75_2269 [Ruegeria conchae]|uniref:Uncharacterized protein n=1 Tax=Ruegeria conchae TaxID=981384 RepID=A0A497ZH91_9RHOB|nr:hypothetical protein CLV75_2269 [Ruegeria conchae]
MGFGPTMVLINANAVLAINPGRNIAFVTQTLSPVAFYYPFPAIYLTAQRKHRSI